MTDSRCAGFTLVELVVATAIMMIVMGGVFSLLNSVQGMFAAQPELTDMQQRLRVCIDALTKDLMMAESISPDPWSSGRMTLSYSRSGVALPVTFTYWHKVDPIAHAYQLMRFDGDQSDLPIADNVVKLSFEYFGVPDIRRVRVTLRVQVATASLRGASGPLFVYGGTSRGGERYVPDQEVVFDVAPRNLH